MSRVELDGVAEVQGLVDAVYVDEDFSRLVPHTGEEDPFVISVNGGIRLSPESLVHGLFGTAFLHMHVRRMAFQESVFVRIVHENFDEFRRAVRGEQVRALIMVGLTTLAIEESEVVHTPWGTIYPARTPKHVPLLSIFGAQTSSVLIQERLVPVYFDKAANPITPDSLPDGDVGAARILLPLACALATSESARIVPQITWYTLTLPFQNNFGFSTASGAQRNTPSVAIGDRIDRLEEWARVVSASHVPAVDVAAKRIVSSTAVRSDPADALIDAVMVWENLVGTSAETTFRVTASLAKALEPDKSKRRDLRKSLGKVYDTRSRVVHGVAVDDRTVRDASEMAVDVAIRIMANSYRRGKSWLELSSTERADTLLLEE